MVKINSFRSNYMARRAELMGVIEANERPARMTLATTTGATCAVGQGLRVLGHYNVQQLQKMENKEAEQSLARITGLRLRTIQNVMLINDLVLDNSVRLRALRAYLINKNAKRALAIVNADRESRGLYPRETLVEV